MSCRMACFAMSFWPASTLKLNSTLSQRSMSMPLTMASAYFFLRISRISGIGIFVRTISTMNSIKRVITISRWYTGRATLSSALELTACAPVAVRLARDEGAIEVERSFPHVSIGRRIECPKGSKAGHHILRGRVLAARDHQRRVEPHPDHLQNFV